jgi:hypothetical protein
VPVAPHFVGSATVGFTITRLPSVLPALQSLDARLLVISLAIISLELNPVLF